VGPRTGLDDAEKIKFLTLPGLEIQTLSSPARSQSLYRLRISPFSFVIRFDVAFIFKDTTFFLCFHFKGHYISEKPRVSRFKR
jgi:hypothetical protein